MVNSCCVPECKSCYKSVKKSDKVALFRFPKSTSDARLINDKFKLKKQADLLFDNEKVANLSEFKEKINQESLPSGYESVTEDSNISFYYIKKSTNNILDAPLLLGTVIVTDKLEIQMLVSSTSIPTSSYDHLLQSSTNTIKTTTELLNLLSFCKSA